MKFSDNYKIGGTKFFASQQKPSKSVQFAIGKYFILLSHRMLGEQNYGSVLYFSALKSGMFDSGQKFNF